VLEFAAAHKRYVLTPGDKGFSLRTAGIRHEALIALARGMGALSPFFYDLLPDIEAVIRLGDNEADDEPPPDESETV